MFDPELLFALIQSPHATPLTDAFMTEFVKHYKDENSNLGGATRSIVLALSDSSHPIFKDMDTMEVKLLTMMARDLNRKILKGE